MAARMLLLWAFLLTAKVYILYRDKRAQIRRVKSSLGVEDDLKVPPVWKG